MKTKFLLPLLLILLTTPIHSSIAEKEAEDEKKKLSKDKKFARRVLRGFYAGPNYFDEYLEIKENAPVKLERNIEHCYNKVLNKPKIISFYDQYFCQGYAIHRTTRSNKLKFNLNSDCNVNNNNNPNEKSFAFCEGFEENNRRRILV